MDAFPTRDPARTPALAAGAPAGGRRRLGLVFLAFALATRAARSEETGAQNDSEDLRREIEALRRNDVESRRKLEALERRLESFGSPAIATGTARVEKETDAEALDRALEEVESAARPGPG